LLPFEGAGPLAYKQSFGSRAPAGQAGLKPDEGHGGAVTLIQRFRSAANLTMGERIGAAELR